MKKIVSAMIAAAIMGMAVQLVSAAETGFYSRPVPIIFSNYGVRPGLTAEYKVNDQLGLYAKWQRIKVLGSKFNAAQPFRDEDVSLLSVGAIVHF